MATGDRNYDIAKESSVQSLLTAISQLKTDIAKVRPWYAAPGTDVTLKSYAETTSLNYQSYSWDNAKLLFELTVPEDGEYQVNVTMRNPRSSGSAGGRVYVGTDKSNYTSVAVQSIANNGETGSASGPTMYLRRGERITFKCEGESTGSAELTKVTVTYNKVFI